MNIFQLKCPLKIPLCTSKFYKFVPGNRSRSNDFFAIWYKYIAHLFCIEIHKEPFFAEKKTLIVSCNVHNVDRDGWTKISESIHLLDEYIFSVFASIVIHISISKNSYACQWHVSCRFPLKVIIFNHFLQAHNWRTVSIIHHKYASIARLCRFKFNDKISENH